MHLVTFYLALVGTYTATTQALRGVVRGAGKLLHGKPREALGEVAGGFLAPVKSAYQQSCRLGEDICRTASALGTADDEPEAQPEALPGPMVQRRPAIVQPMGEVISG